MNIKPRLLATQIIKAAESFSGVLLTGPRQSGKTTLLKYLLPDAHYVLLEDPDIIHRVKSDPRGFLNALKLPAIIDEIQEAPELMRYIRTYIDNNPDKKGQWFLTGSQEAPLMQGVSESMAGRVAILQLLPFSTQESDKVNVLHGGYPDVLATPSSAGLWFRSYVQTYLERDVRAISAIKDLTTFRRFIALLATRHGCMLNKTDFAAPLGITVPTVTNWLNILEITGQILVIPPFYQNFGKRIIKTPKVYFTDSGLACYFLGITNNDELQRSPFYGELFEGYVASEIIKQQINRGERKELYYFRDLQGLEVDFVIPQGANKIALVEAKATETPLVSMGKPIRRLSKNISDYKVKSYLVCKAKDELPGHSLGSDIQVVDIDQLLNKI